MDDETPLMGDVWKIVNRELHARHLQWADLARAIGVSDQAVGNWKIRQKVPPKRHMDIAAFFGPGWTVERLMGIAPEPPPPPVAAEPVYTKRANDIAKAFDELRDRDVRQNAYAAVMWQLQMAKAGQHLADPPPPPAPETPPPTPPTPKSPQLGLVPKKTPHRDR